MRPACSDNPAIGARRRVRKNTHRGVALVMTLIAVIVAGIVATSFLAAQGTAVGIARNINAHARARYIAETGLELTLTYINGTPDWRTEQDGKPGGVWVADAEFGGGRYTVVAEDGQDTDGDGVITAPAEGDGSLTDDSTDPVTLTVTGRYDNNTCVVRALVRPGNTSSAGNRLLFVVPDPGDLSWHDALKLATFEAWGYDVAQIDENDSPEAYDAAVAVADVVYISERITSNNVGDKLTDAPIGVVTEEGYLHDDLLLSTSQGTSFKDREIYLTDNTHPITGSFALGELRFTVSREDYRRVLGTPAPGLDILARRSLDGEPVLAAMEVGATRTDGTGSPGRRVILPFGDNGFNYDRLTEDGRTLVHRALDWARDGGAGGQEQGGTIQFGNTQAYADQQRSSSWLQIATPVTLAEDATLTAISAYVRGPGSKGLRYAVYSDADGEPDALIAETGAENIGSNTFHWQELPVGPVHLAAGTYWLALAFEHGNQYYSYADDGETHYRLWNAVDWGFSPSWDWSLYSRSRSVSIYGIATIESDGGNGNGSGGGTGGATVVRWLPTR